MNRLSDMNRLSNKDILSNFAMIEARLNSEPESAAEWITIRDALRTCTLEADRRIAEAKEREAKSAR